jgi:hypothetical protein
MIELSFSQPAIVPHGEFLSANLQTKQLQTVMRQGMKAGQSHPDMLQALECVKATMHRHGNIVL